MTAERICDTDLKVSEIEEQRARDRQELALLERELWRLDARAETLRNSIKFADNVLARNRAETQK